MPIKPEADMKDNNATKTALEAVANEGLPKPAIEDIVA